jgi:hypothetical protein
MKPLYWVLLILLQVVFISELALMPHDNLFRISYRRPQRDAAVKAKTDNPSAATFAAVTEELRLAGRYVQHRQFVRAGALAGVFVVLDIAFIYGRKHFRREPPTA